MLISSSKTVFSGNYVVASEMAQEPLSEEQEGVLYANEQESQQVSALQRTLSLVELEDREAKLKRADEKISNSKVKKEPVKNQRTALRNVVLTTAKDDDSVPEEKKSRVENALIRSKAGAPPTKSNIVAARHLITSNVLGTNAEKGISDKPLDEGMQAKIKRAATVTARSVGEPVATQRVVRTDIVNNLMKAMSREHLFSEESPEHAKNASIKRKATEKKSMPMAADPIEAAEQVDLVQNLEEKMRDVAKRQVKGKARKAKVAPAAQPAAPMKRRQSIRSNLY